MYPFCQWIWQECKDIKTFFLLLIVIAVVYSPVWIGYLFNIVFGWKWASVISSAYLLLGVGPFTPFFPICIGITLYIKRWTEHRTQQQDISTVSKPEKAITYTKLFWLFIVGSIAGVMIKKGHWETYVVSVLAPYNILLRIWSGTVLYRGNQTTK